MMRVILDDVSAAIQYFKTLSERHGVSLDQAIAIANLLEKARTNDIQIINHENHKPNL